MKKFIKSGKFSKSRKKDHQNKRKICRFSEKNFKTGIKLSQIRENRY